MANDLENSVRRAMERIAKYVEDVATLTVETGYVQLGANADVDFAKAKPAARTTIRLDGDCQIIIPMQTGESGQLEIDGSLFALHERNVNTAIEYRARVLDALLSALQSRTR